MAEDESNKPQATKRTTTQRLRIASGHLMKVVEMSEKGASSLDLLQQVAAVNSALKSCSLLLVMDYVNQQLADGKPVNQQEFMQDLEYILERSMK